jgi:hypothetical protein
VTEVRDLTIRGPIDRAVEAVIVDGRLEVSVDCLGLIPAFQLPSVQAGEQLAIAIANAIHDARKTENADRRATDPVKRYTPQGFADELEPAF